MAGINKVILVGNLGNDPNVLTFENGVKKATFSLATNETYKDKEGNRVEQTEWHNIVVWRGLAEVAEKFLRKGSLIYLEGKIKTRNYEQNGIKKYITEIFGDTFTMLGKMESSGSSQYQPPIVPDKDDSDLPPPEHAPTDDLPF